MATTYRQLLNNVLIALGEDQISGATASITSKYHLLLGLFANQMKEIVEEQHNWRALRTTISVTVPASTTSGTITGANERSRLYRWQDEMSGEEVPLVFDVTDPNNPYRLYEMDAAELLKRITLDTSNGNDPQCFFIDNTGEDAMSIRVWPTPTDERTIQVTMVVPQDRLDAGDLDVNIKVPSRPIEVGVIWYALEERGEELGVNGLFNQEAFDRSLGAAIARDAAEQGEYQLVPV